MNAVLISAALLMASTATLAQSPAIAADNQQTGAAVVKTTEVKATVVKTNEIETNEHNPPSPHKSAAETDWLRREDLSAEQQLDLRPGCYGRYLAPTRDDSSAQLSPDEAPINVWSHQSNVRNEATGKRAIFKDEVTITQGYRQLESDYAELEQQFATDEDQPSTDTLRLDGNLHIREPNLLIRGDSATVNITDNTAQVNQGSYLIHDNRIRGDAKRIERRENNVLHLEDGSYTQCEPNSNAWLLKGSEITIDSVTQQGSAKHVRLYVKDVPVFYWPYMRFPAGNQRQSGFLFPSFSTSSSKGVNLATPYYFNLAPNYDMTITPNSLDDHGLLYETEFRHLNRYFYSELNLSFLSDDEGGEDRDSDFKGEDRWLVSLQQQGGTNQPWSSTIDYTEISDINYFRDLDTTASVSSNSETHLKQRIAADYQFQHWRLGAEALQFQTIVLGVSPQYKQLPQLVAEGEYIWGDWSLNLDHEWTRFDHSDADESNSTLLTGDRARLHYNLSWDNRWEAGFIRPSVQVKHLQYALDKDTLRSSDDSSPSITAAQGIIDAGLFFERDGSLFGSEYLQTLEPRIYYFRSPFKDHSSLFGLGDGNRNIDFDTSELTFSYSQLFRDTRFSGGDRIDDANQLTIGVTNRFIDTHSGQERLNVSIGQIIYFDDRKVVLSGDTQTRNDSNTAARISSMINEHWELTSDLLYDHHEEKMENGNVEIRYRGERKQVFNLGYRYDRKTNPDDTTEQVDSDIIIPLVRDRWHLFARGAYDITNERELELLGGLEYNDCCYRVRIAWRRWLDNEQVSSIDDSDLEVDKGIFIEFQLRGLGAIGDKLYSTLDENIDGYAQWEQQYR